MDGSQGNGLPTATVPQRDSSGSHHSQRPNSFGGANSAQQPQHFHDLGVATTQPSWNQQNNNPIMMNKFQQPLPAERPMSRGTNKVTQPQPLLGHFVPPAPLQQQQQQPTYQISQDSQNFHFPAGQGFPPANMGGGNNNNGQPSFHFIANKQKFYAQITPDKVAPLMFSEKRPFTATNPMIGGGASSIGSQSVGANTVSSGFHQSGKRGNSHNSKQQQHQQQHQQLSNGLPSQPLQPYQQPSQQQSNPYHQLASKTHTGAFGAGLQQMMTQGVHQAIQQSASKFVTSSSGNDNNQLVSIFANPNGSEKTPPIKMKVKPPTRGNIKEKEQLYEDAIKLKIQLNSCREENVKLKTKIKILENDMSKQEKAMEDFILKFNGNNLPSNNFPNLGSSPLLNSNNPVQSNPSSAGGVSNNSAAHMVSMISGAASVNCGSKQQSETFLVMSLKKQVKELKIECLKKEEELETLRKSLKNTRFQEIEQEIKSYIEECQRLRTLLQNMIHEGPKHPLYQERLAQLEQQRQGNEFAIAQLQAQNQEMQKQLQGKEEELQAKQGEKTGKKEIKQELNKARKTLREKDKEIQRLKQEVNNNKKAQSQGSKDSGQPQASNQASGIACENNSFTSKDALSKPDDGSQLKSLQKKLRDLTNDSRAKKSRIDDLESQLKSHQDKLTAKQDELKAEAKKLKLLEDDLAKAKKGQIVENEAKKYQKELEMVVMIARKQQLSHGGLCKRLKEEGVEKVMMAGKLGDKVQWSQFVKEMHLKEGVQMERIVPYYLTLSEQYTTLLYNDAISLLKPLYPSVFEPFTGEDSIPLDRFTSTLQSILTPEHLDLLTLKHLILKPTPTTSSSKKQQQLPVLCIDLKQLRASLESFKGLTVQTSPKKHTKAEEKKSEKKEIGEHQVEEEEQYQSDHEKVEEEVEEETYEDEEFENDDKKLTTKKANQKDKKQKQAIKSDSKQEELQNHKSIESNKSKKQTSSDKPKKAKAQSSIEKEEETKNPANKYMDEEEMLDIAEHCFIKMAESLLDRGRTARSIFIKYSIPEQFPDGTVLELLSPIGFLEGVKEAAGVEELSEMEAACLLRVLAKPELDNAIILNEFTMIMENFGVPDVQSPQDRGGEQEEEEDEDEYDDFIREEDYEESEGETKDPQVSVTVEGTTNKPVAADGPESAATTPAESKQKKLRARPRRRKINLNFEDLEPKGHKILVKLARFLLERYMHPREFYGSAISRQMIKCMKKNHPVDILPAKDFYSRMKAAGVRRTIKENESLSKFLRLDAKFPHLMQMKKVVKALEEVAQIEQKKMQEEMTRKMKEEQNADKPVSSSEVAKEIKETAEEEDPSSDEVDEEEELQDKKRQQKARARKAKKGKPGANLDLLREAGIGMNDYFVGAGGAGKLSKSADQHPSGSLSAKMALLMGAGSGFTQLNTIEEEKHETQTSNYYRENNGTGIGGGGANFTESERDYDNTTSLNMRGSRILDEDLINSSAKYSPHRLIMDSTTNQNHSDLIDFPQSAKQSKGKQLSLSNHSPIIGNNHNSSNKKANLVSSSDHKKTHHNDSHINQLNDDYNDDDDEVEEEVPPNDHQFGDHNQDDDEEEDIDYDVTKTYDDPKSLLMLPPQSQGVSPMKTETEKIEGQQQEEEAVQDESDYEF